MSDLRMMFCVIQPPYKKGKKRPIAKDYIKVAHLSISTLIRTGFPPSKIICFTPEEKHVERMKKKLGIDARMAEVHIPKDFRYWINKNDQHLYFYKPLTFVQMMPEPIDDDTIMVFSDIDIMWQKNPYDFLMNQPTDVWVSRGTGLPRRNNHASSRYKKWIRGVKPKLNELELSEYYYKVDDRAMAKLQLKYGFPIPENHLYMFTGTVAIKPCIYKNLISLWHDMCCYFVKISQGIMPEIGDQSVFSAAVWYLGLSNMRGGKEVGGYIKHYGGERKSEMKKDYHKYCKRIDTRRRRKELKHKSK